MLNVIDRAAFAAEGAEALRAIDQHKANIPVADAPRREAINQLAHQLGREAGVPRAAAEVLARRIVDIEYRLAVLEAQR